MFLDASLESHFHTGFLRVLETLEVPEGQEREIGDGNIRPPSSNARFNQETLFDQLRFEKKKMFLSLKKDLI